MTVTDSAYERLGPDRIEHWTSLVTSGSADRFQTWSPGTGEPLAAIPESGVEDVRLAFARARERQPGWATTSIGERGKVLLRLHDLVLDRQTELLDVIQAESGKARKHAFEEVCDVALTARYVARTARRHLSTRRRAGVLPVLTDVHERRVPYGVVGLISPWNYPLTLAISDALPALAAGNAVVLKPDRQTTLTALFGQQLLLEAGLPEGLLQVVAGDGPVLGGELVEQADYVSFTGSTAVGRRIAARCGERLIGCTMELGGKNPLLVLDDLNDAGIDRAAEGTIRSCFSNAGQLCIAAERLFVADRVYDRFVERLLSRVESMNLGVGFDFGPDMGSLISSAQLDRVRAHLDDAVAKGATVLSGGNARPDLGPLFFEPTVLTGVTPQMACYGEETFGPLVSVYRVENDDEAVARANDTSYGLNAMVFGRDPDRARRVAARLRTGSVNIDEAYTPAWGSMDAPMGGFGASGLGRRHGAEGIRKYTEGQTIARQRLHPIQPVGAMSYQRFARLMSLGLRALKRTGRR